MDYMYSEDTDLDGEDLLRESMKKREQEFYGEEENKEASTDIHSIPEASIDMENEQVEKKTLRI